MEKALVEMTQAALNLVREPYEPFTNKYGKYSSIYMAPTGNAKDMMAEFKGVKRILAVGGAGAYGFEGAINGAEVVDMFDCNVLQKCFFELVKAAIIILDYEEFMEYFTLRVQRERMTYQELKNLLSPVLFFKVCDLLPFDVAFMYGMLYENFDNVHMIKSALYRYEHALYREYLTRFASMYDEEGYYKLQSILRSKSCKISYNEASLIDLPKKFDGPYDLIVLDNILQYYPNIAGLNKPYDVDVFIKKELSKLLAPGGTIQVNYGFEIATVCLKKKLGISYPKNAYNSNPIAERHIKDQMKTDINVALIGRGDYEFSVIEGVETLEGREAENIVLKYKKK